jgi:hypothetical protein
MEIRFSDHAITGIYMRDDSGEPGRDWELDTTAVTTTLVNGGDCQAEGLKLEYGGAPATC